MRYLVIALAVIAITAHDARAGSAGGSSSSYGVGYDQQHQQGSSTGGNANSNSNASAGASSSSGSKSISSASGGAGGGGGSVTQVYQGGGSSTIHNTPDAVPSTIYGGTNPCAVGASAAMSVAGLGIGGGGMWNSPGCERRNGAVILFQANLPDVAIALLCQDDEMRTAFRQSGRPCPADRAQVAAAEPVAAPAPMAVAAPPPVAVSPAPEAAPEASSSGGPRNRPDWCESTHAPRPSDHGPDATSYRFYCQ